MFQIKLQFGLDDDKIIKDGLNPTDAYNKLKEIAEENNLEQKTKTLYTCKKGDGFVNAMAFVINIIEHNYWFKDYVNIFIYEDEETKENLLKEYLVSLKTFPYHGCIK